MDKKKKAPKSAWKQGQSGNPAGRPVGARNKSTMIALAVMSEDAELIARTVTQAALGGDMQACRLVIERLVPPLKERPVELDFPDTDTLAGVSAAQDVILQAVGAGDLLPGEANTLSNIVEQRRKAIETQELEARIAALEATKQ